MEMGYCERLMVEGKPVCVLHTEGPEIVVNDDLIQKAIEVFKESVHEIGNKHNGSKDGLKTKADEVKKLEKYIRENLAVDKNLFRFLEDRKLTDHEVVWRIGGENKIIKWTKLLKAYGRGRGDSLGVLPKDRQYFKELLIAIVEEFGDW